MAGRPIDMGLSISPTRPPCITARDFYGPEGVYGGFAGHDVTKAFALNSLEEKDLDVAE